MTVQDRDYVVSSINYMFPELNITADDIESSSDRLFTKKGKTRLRSPVKMKSGHLNHRLRSPEEN